MVLSNSGNLSLTSGTFIAPACTITGSGYLATLSAGIILNGVSLIGAFPSASLTGTLSLALLPQYPTASLTGTYPSASVTGTFPAASITGTFPSASITGTALVRCDGSTQSGCTVRFSNDTSGLCWGANYSNIYDDGDLRFKTDDNMHFYSNNVEKLTINNNGIAVGGSINFNTNGTNSYIYNDSNPDLNLSSSYAIRFNCGSTQFVMKQSGVDFGACSSDGTGFRFNSYVNSSMDPYGVGEWTSRHHKPPLGHGFGPHFSRGFRP